MAKRYINETGLKHLWDSVNSVFAKKEDIKIDLLVNGVVNPLDNYNVPSLDKDYDEIKEAILSGKDVRLLLTVPMGGEDYSSVLGSAEMLMPSGGDIIFGVIVDVDLYGTGEAQLYHIGISYTKLGSVITEIKTLSGESIEQEVVSPTVTVTQIEGGHRVVITNADGAKTFDVLDGAKGDRGYSVHYVSNNPNIEIGTSTAISIDYFQTTIENIQVGDCLIDSGGGLWTVTSIVNYDGYKMMCKKVAQIKGDAFTYADFTPEQLEALKGKDYVLTDSDKSNIADIVLGKLQSAEEASF